MKDRVARILLLWVNNHFTDFETDSKMMSFLEHFEECLQEEKMTAQLRLLNMACSAKAKVRCVTLTRSDRDEPLNFQIVGGYERSCGIYVSGVSLCLVVGNRKVYSIILNARHLQVESGSKAEGIGLKRGDQILCVNGQSFLHITYTKAVETLCSSTHLSITVKANLSGE